MKPIQVTQIDTNGNVIPSTIAPTATKGKIEVNNFLVEASGRKIIALSFDLRAKYAVIEGYSNTDGAPSIMLGTKDVVRGSLDKNGDVITEGSTIHWDKRRKHDTELLFIRHKDWVIHCATICRYTLRICLVKNK